MVSGAVCGVAGGVGGVGGRGGVWGWSAVGWRGVRVGAGCGPRATAPPPPGACAIADPPAKRAQPPYPPPLMPGFQLPQHQRMVEILLSFLVF